MRTAASCRRSPSKKLTGGLIRVNCARSVQEYLGSPSTSLLRSSFSSAAVTALREKLSRRFPSDFRFSLREKVRQWSLVCQCWLSDPNRGARPPRRLFCSRLQQKLGGLRAAEESGTSGGHRPWSTKGLWKQPRTQDSNEQCVLWSGRSSSVIHRLSSFIHRRSSWVIHR